MATEGRVALTGLKDFQRELRRIDSELPKELRKVNLAAAALVAEATRASFASRPTVPAAVATSVKALAGQKAATVRIGGSGKAAAALGHEFGGGKYGKGRPTPGGGHTTQFPKWRGTGAGAGYSLYPALRSKTGQLVEMYGDALDELARRAFPD